MVSNLSDQIDSEQDLYMDFFTSSEKKTLSDEERLEIIRRSKETAESLYFEHLNSPATRQLDVTKDLIRGYEVSIHENPQEAPLIANFDNNAKQLTVFSSSVRKLYEKLTDYDDFDLNEEEYLNTILSHELFHIIEMNEENIYTYRHLKEEKILFFKKPARIEAASEVGAFHFSKLMNDLPYSPIIFNTAWA